MKSTFQTYRRAIVGVSFLNLTVVFGIRLSFSVFFVALIDEYGWLRADTSLIFSTSMVVFALTSTLAGMAIDRWRARRIFILGIGLLVLGLLLSSRVRTLWQLALTYGVIASLGITILGLGQHAALISRWYQQHRGMAIGLAFAGTGVGALLLTPSVEHLISLSGWRTAYLGLAGIALLLLPLVFFLLRPPPASPSSGHAGARAAAPQPPAKNWTMRAALRAPAFWLIIIASIGALAPVRTLTVHQLAAMTDAGVPRGQAASVVGLSGGVTALTFILFGALSDRIGRRLTYALGSVCLLAAIIILHNMAGLPSGWLLVYAVLFGMGEGARSSLLTAIASDLFPGNALGAINGTVGAAFGLGAAALPWLAGRIYDVQGTYTTAFGVAVGVVIVSALALWLAPVVHEKSKA